VQRLQIEECQEINRLELPVNCRWPADGCTQCKVGTKQFGNRHRLGSQLAQWTFKIGKREGTPWRFRQVPGAEVRVHGSANGRILGAEGTAAEEIAPAMLARVIGNAFPEQAKDDEVPMLWMDTSSTQLDHLCAPWFKDMKLKFMRAIIAQVSRCIWSGLQPVGADYGGRWHMLYQQMIADDVEGVFVKAGHIGFCRPDVEFKVENLKAQRLRRAKVIQASCKSSGVVNRSPYHEPDGIERCFHGAHPLRSVCRSRDDWVNCLKEMAIGPRAAETPIQPREARCEAEVEIQ